jgi:RHS repeat-associated protein
MTGKMIAPRRAGVQTVARRALPFALSLVLGSAVAGSVSAQIANELVTTTTYQVGSSSAASNVLPVAVSTGSGDGLLTATTTTTYDPVGNVLTVDGPLPGAVDTTRSFYDVARQVTGVVGPDPDGMGWMSNRATRTTYNANGQPTIVEQGTTTSQSATAMSSFQSLVRTETSYDPQSRPIKQVNIGTDNAITGVSQTAYDTSGRAICATARMNPAVFASPQADACALGTEGVDGPDRIARTTYDAVDRVTQLASGYGTTSVRIEKTTTYTTNGQPLTLADGKGNLTTYEYDGFDRLAKARYPNATCCTSSTVDFDAYGYDAASNRTSWQHRPSAPGQTGETVYYAYDALNRMTYHGGVQTWVYYDNLSRPTVTLAGPNSEKAIAHYYDGLGRPSYTYDYRDGTWFPIYTGYDLAGRRTTLQWSDGNYVTYQYDNTNAMIAVRENGSDASAFVLALMGYDNLGRRVVTYRANSAQSYYGYDNASRLNSLNIDLVGTAQDQTWAYTYSAADQVKTRTSSNSAYDWAPTATVNRGYAINGLNQAISAGAATLAYDGRGNLSSDGATSFVYDLDNRLTSASGGSNATLSYDPAGRLGQTTGSASTRFVYSGSDLIAELNTSNVIIRRYVPGSGPDEPLISYEGSGMSDRRYPLADAQGSIAAITNAAGVATINTYDEYGIPAASNVGRFQYTGQTWLPEVGLYNYKARLYSPTLGRFLQTDPSGYDDGLNWYAYVGNDPLNRSDPTGNQAQMAQCSCTTHQGTGMIAPDNMTGLGISEDPDPANAGQRKTAEAANSALTHGGTVTDVTSTAAVAAMKAGGGSAGDILAALKPLNAVSTTLNLLSEGAQVYVDTKNGMAVDEAIVGGLARFTSNQIAVKGGEAMGAAALSETIIGAPIGAAMGGVSAGFLAETSGLNRQNGNAAIDAYRNFKAIFGKK